MPSHNVYCLLIIALIAFPHTVRSIQENETLPIITDSNASGDPASATEDVDLLKWALKHSDPESLHQQAEEAKKANKNDPDAAERRARAAELLQAVNDMPSESLLMEEAVLVLHNISSTVDNKSAALEALIVLVEPIDNANHLLKINNATSELNRLLGSAPGLEAAAARVLGVAASNNDFFSNELIQRHPDVILRLVQLLSASADDTVAAAVYAAGQLLRNSGQARGLWKQSQAGEVLVAMIRGGKQVSERSRKKALTLAGDLVLLDVDQNSSQGKACSAFSGCESLINVLLDVLEEQYRRKDKKMDLDLVEKALLALQAATAQDEVSSGGGGGGGRSEAVIGKLIDQLKQGDSNNGQVSEYEQDVIALAQQLLRNNNKGSPAENRDEL
jgi:hypothetical protein